MKTKKEYYDLAIIVVVIFFLDRLTKLLVINNIALNESIEVTNFFSLTYWTNTGIAFGFFQNANIVLTLVTIVVIGVICYYFKYLTKTKLSTVATSLILGGAFGNLADRFIYGAVIDFINFHFWPAFNVADSAVTIGGILLAWTLWREK